MTVGDVLYYTVAFIIGVLAVGRLTRLLVDDTWPPVMWWRGKWDGWTQTSGWNELFHCGWCISVWIALPWTLWAWLSDLHWSWWVVSLWLAVAYAAAIVNARDIPAEDRDGSSA